MKYQCFEICDLKLQLTFSLGYRKNGVIFDPVAEYSLLIVICRYSCILRDKSKHCLRA